MTELASAEWIRQALERYEKPLIRYACRLTGDLETARDVVQDAFLRLCQTNRAKVDGHLAAWLYTVCRNRAYDVRKKEGRMDALTEGRANVRPSDAQGPRAVAEQHEALAKILDVLGELPQETQEAFRLKFEDGLNYREISQVMDVSLGKVSNLIATALDTLRQRLQGELGLAQEV